MLSEQSTAGPLIMKDMFEDLPLRLSPVYETRTISAPIVLHEGPCALGHSTSSLAGNASVSLEWLPYPRLAFRWFPSTQDHSLRIAPGPTGVEFPRLGARAEATVTSTPMLFWAHETRPAEGRIDQLVFGRLDQCTRIRFHLPNFSFFLGELVRNALGGASSERAVLEYGGFRTILDRCILRGDELENALPSDGGYAITHVGTVERVDGSTFSYDDAEAMLDCLGYFFSFCRAAWTVPILLCAEDATGRAAGQRWELKRIDRYKRAMSWLPVSEPVSDHMLRVFAGYAAAWFSPTWGGAIRTATELYVEASTGDLEKSVIIAQVAFELLAWTRLVQETAVISPKAWNGKSMPFSGKLRRLLQSCSIPLSIPPTLNDLQAYCTLHKLADGAEGITNVRNALVHPSPTKRKRLHDSPGAAIQAWVLSLWYLDLLLLNVCAYKGRYSNRTIAGWRGNEIVTVPWS